MICRLAQSYDMPLLRELWYECFLEHDGKESIDYYFANNFKLETTFILEVQEKIVCSLQLNQHELMIDDCIETVSFVVGVATFINERKKGYMKVLLNYAIEYARTIMKQNFMILQAYNWDIYRPFGFVEYYYKNKYTISINDIKNINKEKEELISYNCNLLLEIYNDYTKDKNGYKIRDVNYYTKLIRGMEVDGIKILATNGAYLFYSIVENQYNIIESAYRSLNDLTNLLSMLKDNHDIIVNVDEYTIIPNVKKERSLFMMIKYLSDKKINNKNMYISEWI